MEACKQKTLWLMYLFLKEVDKYWEEVTEVLRNAFGMDSHLSDLESSNGIIHVVAMIVRHAKEFIPICGTIF